MESLKIYQNFPLLVIIINFSLHFQTSLSRNQKKRSNSFWLINNKSWKSYLLKLDSPTRVNNIPATSMLVTGIGDEIYKWQL